ncbi:acetyl-CoA acetyltransferase [Paenarthrobacter sp. NPDC089989]|uniref:acetyl-CoA acetyltransferase n=1 Tax=unclassified Paenarthrobacter TaxID=2634190 RepID=UPI00381EB071
MSLKDQFGKDILLTGWGHSKFGKLSDDTLETLIVQVAGEAIRNSGLDPKDIDEIYLGQFNSGMQPLGFTSSLALQLSEDLGNVPATRTENACASGSAAFQQGVKAVLAGTARNVLVIGAEKMTDAGADVVGAALLGASYEMAGKPSTTGFTGLFAEVAKHYDKRYGSGTSGAGISSTGFEAGLGDVLGSISAKNHRNGMDNPYAQMHRDFGEEFCRTISDKNPMVADPLRRTDCSPVSDGAAAVVLSTRATNGATAAVRLAGFGHANDFFPAEKRDPTEFAATRASWERAFGMAGVGVNDLDFAEVHDCFTIAELIMYEAMGLTSRGEGSRAIKEGWVYKDGKLPVNVSGGLKAKGHPVGATGVSQHVIAAMQLTGTAGDMQLPNARRGAVQNMGGVGIANYVSILESL